MRKRYEDVEELLEAGISVLTSINLEYIAEQQDFVRGILGRTRADTVPQVVHRPRRRSRRRRRAARGRRGRRSTRSNCRSFDSARCS